MVTNRINMRGPVRTVALVAVGAFALVGCSAGSDDSSSTGEFSYLSSNANTTIAGTLEALSGSTCADAAEAAPLSAEQIDGATFDQQIQLLASQDALSNMSMAPGTPSIMSEFIEAGKVLNLSETIDELGIESTILPAAEATLKALYGTDDLYAVPTEYNIEGFWYNKALFDEAGVEIPTTWDELVDAAATLSAAGIQPFVAAGSGGDGWAVSRLIGNYIFRDLGPDALQAVADGEASLTDPEYVAGAEAVAELGAAGYFGAAPGSVDYNTAMSQFLTGGGAMYYMGSWAVSSFNDAEQNQIGADNIGFFDFPEVEGGAGSASEIPANAGQPAMFTTNGYDAETTGAWVKCILEGYGNTALNEFGQVTGFEVTEIPADQSDLTTLVQDKIASAEGSVLWFEAKFSAEATTVSQTNAGAVASGSLSGAEFMNLVQAALDK